jgi:hypothetical protein
MTTHDPAAYREFIERNFTYLAGLAATEYVEGLFEDARPR